MTTTTGPAGELVTTVTPSAKDGSVTPGSGVGVNALQNCTQTTGAFIVGTNTNGTLNTATVSCPFGQVAVGIEATWQQWNGNTMCIPVMRRFNLQTVAVDWFSSPAGVGVGCQGNRLAAATLCCVP